MRPWHALVLVLLFPAPARGAGDAGSEEPTFARFVHPFHVEAAPVVSPPVSPVPRTQLVAGLGFLYGTQENGRTTYRILSTRLVVGGEWSPEKLPALGLGAELVAFQTTHYNTDLPPAVDEWRHFFDLGPLRIHAHYMALAIRRGKAELALTPFLRFVFPTDTSRIREFRDMPIRHVLDDRAFSAPYFYIEPGASLGFTVAFLTLYTHQSPVLAPVHGESFQFFWSMHYGVAVDILELVDVSVEVAGLLRATRAHQEDPDRDREGEHGPYFTAFALCPGVRLKKGAFTYEVAARIGLTEDAYHAYGDFTLAFALTWIPGKGK
jgi:hypothetical protein